MKHITFLFLTITVFFLNNEAFGKTHSKFIEEIESLQSSSEDADEQENGKANEVLGRVIVHLEIKIRKQLYHAQSHLEKWEIQLDKDSEDEVALSKIRKYRSRIMELNEVIISLELLKLKI